MGDAPDFSIVLCTRDRAHLLGDALSSIAKMDFPPERFELVLVDNASSDDTRDVADRFASSSPFDVLYVVEERVGLSSARNRGIAEARGRWVFFTDDDQLVDPQALREHARVAEKYQSRVQQGGIELRFPDGQPAWLRGFLAALLGKTPDHDEGPYELSLYGGNMVFRRELFREISGFRPELGKGTGGYDEDSEITLRLRERGETIVFAPSAIVYHVIRRDRTTPGYFVKMCFDKGRSSGGIDDAGLARVSWRSARRVARQVVRALPRAWDQHERVLVTARSAQEIGRVVGRVTRRR